jgi:hypothetical protein
MIWYGMMWYDMVWYDMIWCDMIWYDIWYDTIWYDMTWYDMIRYDIWYDKVGYDKIWYAMLWWYGMVYDICDMIWYVMMIYDMIWYDIWYDIFVNCNWVATRWQQYSTHLHTNNTQNNTKQTIHRTTQQFWKSAGRAPSLRVLPWHLPYSWGKSTGKSVRVAEECQLARWRYINVQ